MFTASSLELPQGLLGRDSEEAEGGNHVSLQLPMWIASNLKSHGWMGDRQA